MYVDFEAWFVLAPSAGVAVTGVAAIAGARKGVAVALGVTAIVLTAAAAFVVAITGFAECWADNSRVESPWWSPRGQICEDGSVYREILLFLPLVPAIAMAIVAVLVATRRPRAAAVAAAAAVSAVGLPWVYPSLLSRHGDRPPDPAPPPTSTIAASRSA